MHHTSVDKLAILHKMDAYFPCPSDKREDKEEENNDPDRIGANVSGIFDSQVVFFLPKRIEPLRIQFSPDRGPLFYDLLTPPFKLLSTGGCHLCKTCTYPDAPCRFPDRMSPSISSYGIIAANLAESAGMPYINGENTVTYFGLLCFGKA